MENVDSQESGQIVETSRLKVGKIQMTLWVQGVV